MSKPIRITIRVKEIADIRGTRDQIALTGDGGEVFRVPSSPRLEVGDQITLTLKSRNSWLKRKGGIYAAEIVGEPIRAVSSIPAKVATTEK